MTPVARLSTLSTESFSPLHNFTLTGRLGNLCGNGATATGKKKNTKEVELEAAALCELRVIRWKTTTRHIRTITRVFPMDGAALRTFEI